MNDIRIQARYNGKESTTLTMNELFSGIGAQSAALKRLGKCFDVTSTADMDKDAIASYAAIHCNLEEVQKGYKYPDAKHMADYLTERNIGYDFEKNKPYDWHGLISKKTGKANDRLKQYYLACVISNNQGDVCKIEKLDYADFWTYSFPCQDISVAGKQEGIEKHTRSGLLYEVERLLNVSAKHGELPKYLMLENVKNLVGKKFKAQFDEWLEYLDELGYNNYWKILNAKNYGIPQNRERVFAISIRKDVDTGDFSFPEGFDNGLRLKDFLEDEVDEKFYISNEKTEKLIKQLDFKNKELLGIDLTINQPKFKDYANCIKARYDAGVSNQRTDGTGVCEPMLFGGEQKNQAIKTDGISTCLTSSMGTGGGYVPMVTEACIPCITPDREENGKAIRKQYEAGEVKESRHNMTELQPREDGISNTLTTVQKDNLLLEPKVAVKEATIQKIGNYHESNHEASRIVSSEGLAPCVKENHGTVTAVAVREATKQGYAEATVGDSINIQFPNSDTRRGRVGKGVANTLETSCNQATLVYDPYNLSLPKDQDAITTLRTNYSNGNAQIINDYRIRKLTPKECWRLMGFTDEEFQKAQDAGVSNSQLYKQAGNSIVVDVLEYIFRNLLT